MSFLLHAALAAGLYAAPLTPAAGRAEGVEVDFDRALAGVGFDAATADGNGPVPMQPNGILDSVEMALVAAILAQPDLDLSQQGGVDHGRVRAAYDQALSSATADTAVLARTYPSVTLVVVGYAMLGEDSFRAIAVHTEAFGSVLDGEYGLARGLSGLLAASGDADGDGSSNVEEYRAFFGGGTAAYVAAALDPAVGPADAPRGSGEPDVFWCPMRGAPCPEKDYAEPGTCETCGMALASKAVLETRAAELPPRRKVGVVLYPGFEVLDAYGPIEMWSYVREFELVTVAEQAGPVRSAQGVSTIADHSFADAPPLDIVLVPGGSGTMTQLGNEAMLEFLRAQHAHAGLTTSVCTGSALLARAGLLDGKRATSNKAYFSLATSQGEKVDWIRRARWVDDGDVVTSSGVSAGMDMALYVVAREYGEERARQIAGWAEYEWHADPQDDPFAVGAGDAGEGEGEDEDEDEDEDGHGVGEVSGETGGTPR